MTTAAGAWPRFGAFSYDFARGDLRGLVAGFTAAGLSAVQLGTGLLDEALESSAVRAAMRAELEANGIAVAALAGYRNLVAPDPARRAANVAFLRRCLEIAPELGTPVVATETGTRNPESDWLASPENGSEATWDLLDAALAALLPVAEAHGSVLALEGYVNNVLATPDQLAATLARFPSPALQVVLDPFNYLSRGLLSRREAVATAFFDRFADRFVVAHLKDVAATGAEVETPEFGHGVFPHRRYADFLRTRRPDLPIILEHLPFAHVPVAIARFRALAAASEPEGTSRWAASPVPDRRV